MFDLLVQYHMSYFLRHDYLNKIQAGQYRDKIPEPARLNFFTAMCSDMVFIIIYFRKILPR